jgi:hypothetical protein
MVFKHLRCYSLPPLKGISSRDSEIKDKGRGKVLTVSRLKKTQILGAEEELGLPSSFFFSMVTPLYLVHLHGMSPSFSFFFDLTLSTDALPLKSLARSKHSLP